MRPALEEPVGKNPYIDAKAAPPPKRAYTLTVKNTGQQIRVDPARLPSGHEGQPGSLLQTLLSAGVPIDHTCGGVGSGAPGVRTSHITVSCSDRPIRPAVSDLSRES